MVKVDLITGFLGAGKTTFIRKYVSYLLSRWWRAAAIMTATGAVSGPS